MTAYTVKKHPHPVSVTWAVRDEAGNFVALFHPGDGTPEHAARAYERAQIFVAAEQMRVALDKIRVEAFHTHASGGLPCGACLATAAVADLRSGGDS